VPPLTDQTDGAGADRSHGNVRPQDGADAVVTICSLCAAPRKYHLVLQMDKFFFIAWKKKKALEFVIMQWIVSVGFPIHAMIP